MLGTIVLGIIKIIGCILLAVILIVAAVFLIPVKYRVRGEFSEEIRISGTLSWMWILLRVPFYWRDGDSGWKIKVLGISWNPQKLRFKKQETKAEKETEVVSGPEQTKPSGKTEPLETVREQTQETGKTENKREQKQGDGETEGIKEVTEPQAEKKSILQKLRERIAGIRKRIREFIRTVTVFLHKIRRKLHSARELAALLREEDTKQFICILKENVIHLWKQIRPRRIRGNILFGTGDPCTTGECLGIIGILYGWVGTGVKITPDFEKKCLEGTLEVKGRIRLLTVVIVVIRMIYSEEWKRFQKEMKQWKEEI